jgi:CRP-like cAMP-binding protein
VVNLGYFLVFAMMYWIYRHARESRIVHGEMPGAVAREPADPSAGLSWEKRVLKGADIFKDLSDEQIAKVASLDATLDVPAGQSLGAAGEPGDRLFIIIRGMAELSAHSGVGEITVRIAGPGESFPLAALLGSGNLITSVEAMTDMQLIAIPRSRLLALFAEEPEIGMKIYEAVAEVLGNRYKSTLTHLTSSAEMALKDMGFFANV